MRPALLPTSLRLAPAATTLCAVLLSLAGGCGGGTQDVDPPTGSAPRGDGKADGLGLVAGTREYEATLTLLNFAAPSTLRAATGTTDEALAPFLAARPVADLASVEAGAFFPGAATTSLVGYATARLETRGLPPCTQGTLELTPAALAAGTEWTACDVVLSENLTLAEHVVLAFYPGASVRVDAVTAARGESVTVDVGADAALGAVGSAAKPVVFASGDLVDITVTGARASVLFEHTLFGATLEAPGAELPSGAADAARIEASHSYVAVLYTFGDLMADVTLEEGELYRMNASILLKDSIVAATYMDSASWSGVSCDRAEGEALVGPRVEIDHAYLADQVSAFELLVRQSVLEGGATALRGSVSDSHIVGDIAGYAWGDEIVKVSASGNSWADYFAPEVIVPTPVPSTGCGADALEVEVLPALAARAPDAGPAVADLSAVVVAVSGLGADE